MAQNWRERFLEWNRTQEQSGTPVTDYITPVQEAKAARKTTGASSTGSGNWSQDFINWNRQQNEEQAGNDINSWISASNGLLNRYGELAGSWRARNDAAYDDFNQRKSRLLSYAQNYRQMYQGNDDAINAINSVVNALSDTDLRGIRDYWSQWDSAEQYNTAKHNYDLYQKYNPYTQEQIDAELAGMDQQNPDRAWLEDYSRQKKYLDLDKNADFAANSRYEKRQNTGNPIIVPMVGPDGQFMPGGGGNVTYTGYSNTNDLLYDYINGDPDALAIQNLVDINSQATRMGTDAGYLREMSVEQISRFNYLYKTKGADSAYEYIKTITPALEQQRTINNMKAWEQEAKKDPIGTSITTFLSSLDAPLAGLEQIADLLDDGKIEQYAGYNRANYYTSTIRGTVSKIAAEKFGVFGETAYQSAMSVGDQVIRTFLAGGYGAGMNMKVVEELTLLTMSSGAAISAISDSIDRGLDETQSVALGIIAGLAEYFTEKIQWGTLFNGNLRSDDWKKYILKNFAQEGNEEFISGAVNMIADLVISGDKAEKKQLYEAYKAQGESDGMALWHTIRDSGIELGKEYLGGALAGGLMGSVSAYFGYHSPVERTADVDNLIRQSLEINPDNQMAKDIRAKFDANQKVTPVDIDRLQGQYETDYQNAVNNDRDLISNAAATRLSDLGETGDVNAIAQAIGKYIQNRSESRMAARNPSQTNFRSSGLTGAERQLILNSRYGQQVLNELNTNSLIQANEQDRRWTGEIGTRMIRPEMYGRFIENTQEQQTTPAAEQQTAAPISPDAWMEQQMRTQNGQQSVPNAAPATNVGANVSTETAGTTESVAMAGREMPRNTSGRFQNVMPATRMTQANKAVPAAVNDMASEYGNQAAAIRSIYNMGTNKDLTVIAPAIRAAYEIGLNGGLESAAMNDSSTRALTPAQRSLAYRVGVAAANNAPKRGNASRKGTVHSDNFKIGGNKYRRMIYNAVNFLAEESGITIEMNDSRGKSVVQGGFNKDTDVLTLDISADINTEEDARKAIKYAALRTFSHELTHFGQKWSSQDYNALTATVLEVMADRYGDEFIEDRIRYWQDRYKNEAGQILSTADAIDEIVAESMTEVLPESQFFEKLIQRSQPTASRLIDALKKFIARLRQYFSNLDTNIRPEVNALMAETEDGTLKYLEGIVEQWDRMMLNAVENYNNALSEENVSTESTPVEETTQNSIRSLAQAGGFKAEQDEYGNVILTRNGQRVSEVTVDDINHSPIGALINHSLDSAYISTEEAAKQKELFARLLTMAAQSNDFVMTMQFAGSSIFTALKSNADKQYKTTYDFPSICTKTQAVIDSMSAAMKAKHGGLTKREIERVYNEVFHDGNPVPCPECYVFSRWVGIGSLLDNIWTYQNKFGKMSLLEVQQAYARMEAEIRKVAEENDLTFGKAKGKIAKQYTDRYNALYEKVTKAQNQGEHVNKASIALLENLQDHMETVKAMTWIDTVYFKDSSHRTANPRSKWFVDPNVLFDLNEGEAFATQYPEAWGFRTTQGAGYGKAITPYSEAVIGEGILGTNSVNNLVKNKKTGVLDNFFLRQNGTLDAQAKKTLETATKNQKNQAFLGGQRFQSTSDARYENAFDYLIAALEVQAMHGMVQAYTKVAGAVPAFYTWGFSTNQSLMPKGGGLDANGRPVDTAVGGMNPEVARRNREQFETQGTITIGVNDNHIRAMMDQVWRDFIIPYHASGGDATLVQSFRTIQESGDINAVRSTDYTRTQSDKILSDDALRYYYHYNDEQIALIKARRKARLDIFAMNLGGKKAAHPDMEIVRGSRFLSALYDKLSEGGEWSGVTAPKKIIEDQLFPNEYWDQTVTYENSGKITRDYLEYCEELGFLHRFSGMVPGTVTDENGVRHGTIKQAYGYDENGQRVALTDLAYRPDGSINDYFWKVLTDRRMYDNDGNYLPQRYVTLGTTSAEDVLEFAGTKRYGEKAGRQYDPEISARTAARVAEEIAKGTDTQENVQHSIRASDAEYMELAKNPEKNREQLQRMVDEAAKEAGYTIKAYHGTYNFGRTKFDADWPTFLTSNPDTARAFSGGIGPRSLSSRNDVDSMTVDELISAAESSTFMKNIKRATKGQIDEAYSRYNDYGKRKIDSANANGEPIFRWSDDNYNDGIVTLSEIKGDLKEAFSKTPKGGTYSFYINPGNSLTVYGNGANYSSIPVDGILAKRLGKKTASTDEILKAAADLGYDSVVYKDIVEGGDYGRAPRSDVYAVVRPDVNMKSTDPVTYDDAGNVIPLSERFNTENQDIRYSIRSINEEHPEATVGLNFNDPTGEHIERVFDGQKIYETRAYHPDKRGEGKIPGAYLNKLTGIVQTGAGRAQLVGYWQLGDPQLRDFEWLRDHAAELGNDGTAYQAKPGDQKWVYPITKAEKIDTPRPVDSTGIRGRQITGTYDNGQNVQASLRTPTYTNRELLEMAANDVSIMAGLTQADRSALEIFKSRLDKMHGFEEQQAEQRRILQELQAAAKPDRDEITKTQNRINLLGRKISAAENLVLDVENKQTLKKVLQHARNLAGNQVRRNERARLQERSDVMKYRERVQTKAKRLSDMILKNSDKEHVPAALRGPLADFVGSIGFDSRRKMNGGPDTKRDIKYTEALDRLRQIVQNQADYMANPENGSSLDYYLDLPEDFSLLIQEHLNQVTAAVKAFGAEDNNQVFAMDSNELKRLDQILTIINHSVSTINKKFVEGRFARIDQAGQNTILDMNERKAFNRSKRAAAISGFFEWKNALPYYAFKKYGAAGQEIFHGIQRGWEKFAFNTNDLIAFTETAYETEEQQAWSNELHKIELEDGRTVQMTTAQIMSLYCLNKREQARGHILGGGVRVGNIEAEAKQGRRKQTVTQTEPFNMTPDDVKAITDTLTDRQREVADALQEYMNTVGTKWGNEVSMARFGYEGFGEKNYFPIESDQTNLPAKDPDAKANDLFRLLNMSMTKALTPKANNALVVSDIFQVFANHMSDMAKYNALALPVLDAMKWINYKESTDKNENGQFKTLTVQRAIEEAYGQEGMSYFMNFMKDLNGKSNGGRDEGVLNGLMSGYKIAAVAANLRVALLQPTAYFRASAVLKPNDMARAVTMNRRQAREERMKYSGISVWKDLGFYDTNIGRNVADLIMHNETIRDKIADKALWLAEKGDAVTWDVIWNACKLDQQKKGLNGEELMQATAERFMEVIYRTQVVDSTLTRTQLMRDKSIAIKNITGFMSEPSVSYNLLLDAYEEFNTVAQKEGKAQAWKTTRGKVWRALGAYAASQLVAAIVESIADAARDDDDYESYLDKWLQAFLGDESFLKGNLFSDMSISAKVPLLKMIPSYLQGYETTDMVTQGIKDLFELPDFLKSQSRPDYGKIYKVAQVASRLGGVPIGNAMREFATIWNNTVGVITGQKLKTYTPNDKTVVKEAYEGGKLTEQKAIDELVRRAGMEEKDAKAQVTKWKYSEWDTNGGGLSQDEVAIGLESGNFTEKEKQQIWKDMGYKTDLSKKQESAKAIVEMDDKARVYNSSNWKDGLQDSSLSNSDKDRLVTAYGSDYFAKPYTSLRSAGYSPAEALRLLTAIDADGNGSVKQAEAYAYLQGKSDQQALPIWNSFGWATSWEKYKARQH